MLMPLYVGLFWVLVRKEICIAINIKKRTEVKLFHQTKSDFSMYKLMEHMLSK